MARGMDEAGLLNSMTKEQLAVTCNRLQRSCSDMEMLLSELEQEQAMLRREQDRLQQRIEKTTSQADVGKKDRGIIWNLFNDANTNLEVSHIFKAKEERKAAKRRRWTRPSEAAPAQSQRAREEDSGPFSEASLQASWGYDWSQGVLRQPPSRGPDLAELEEWVRTSVCGEPVAEAEPLPENAEMWARQFAASAAGVQQTMSCPTPNSSPPAGAADATGFMNGEPGAPRMWSPRCEGSPPHRSPPPSARRSLLTIPTDGSSRGPNMAPLEALQEGEAAASPAAGAGEDALEPSPTGYGEGGSFEALVGSALGIERKTTSRKGDGPAPASFSRRMTEAAGGAIQWVAELAAGAGGAVAETSMSRGDPASGGEAACAVVSLTVVLQRKTAAQLWGLAWMKDGFERKGERIVEKTMKGSVAESWNKQQEQIGHPERCIRPYDRLVSVNGKTGREEIKGELASQEVVLEFQRLVPQKESVVVQQAKVGAAAPAAPPGAAAPEAKPAADVSPRRDLRKAKFQDAFSAYLQAVAPAEKAEAETADSTQVTAGIPDTPKGLGVPEDREAPREPPITWTSPASQSVSADLRGTVCPAAAGQQAAAAGGTTEQTSSPPRANRTRVASALGSFLEQGALRSAEPRAAGPAGMAAVGPPRQAPSFTASTATASTAPAGGEPMPARQQPAVVMGPVVDPLSTAKPSVVACKPLDPAAEKRDISERLRIRHGNSRMQEISPGFERKLSESMDSDDDGSLMRLSHALSSLERTAAASSREQQRSDAVAEEGHHRMERRLDLGPEEPIHPGREARPSAITTFVEVPMPAARPAPGPASSASLAEHDSRGPAASSDGPATPAPLPEQPSPAAAAGSPCSTLSVQVSDDKTAQIRFAGGDDLPRLVEDFLAENGVKDLFREPLLRHVQAMRESGRREDAVDIVDLLD